MTELLNLALDELRKRSPAEQDSVAALILDELEDDRRWDDAFVKSPDKLAEMARRAREAVDEGRSQSVGWDEL